MRNNYTTQTQFNFFLEKRQPSDTQYAEVKIANKTGQKTENVRVKGGIALLTFSSCPAPWSTS